MLFRSVFAGFAAAWTGLVAIQILLGALSIWSKKAPSLTAAIEADFTAWLRENIDKLPVAREQVEEILKGRAR